MFSKGGVMVREPHHDKDSVFAIRHGSAMLTMTLIL